MMLKKLSPECVRFSSNWTETQIHNQLFDQFSRFRICANFTITMDIETIFIDVYGACDERELNLAMGLIIDNIVNLFIFNFDGTSVNGEDGDSLECDSLVVFNPNIEY